MLKLFCRGRMYAKPALGKQTGKQRSCEKISADLLARTLQSYKHLLSQHLRFLQYGSMLDLCLQVWMAHVDLPPSMPAKIFSCYIKTNLPEGPHRLREWCLQDPEIHKKWSLSISSQTNEETSSPENAPYKPSLAKLAQGRYLATWCETAPEPRVLVMSCMSSKWTWQTRTGDAQISLGDVLEPRAMRAAVSGEQLYLALFRDWGKANLTFQRNSAKLSLAGFKTPRWHNKNTLQQSGLLWESACGRGSQTVTHFIFKRRASSKQNK